jgi:hypothetical protein
VPVTLAASPYALPGATGPAFLDLIAYDQGAAPVRKRAAWKRIRADDVVRVGDYRRFWERSTDALAAHLNEMQRTAAIAGMKGRERCRSKAPGTSP